MMIFIQQDDVSRWCWSAWTRMIERLSYVFQLFTLRNLLDPRLVSCVLGGGGYGKKSLAHFIKAGTSYIGSVPSRAGMAVWQASRPPLTFHQYAFNLNNREALIILHTEIYQVIKCKKNSTPTVLSRPAGTISKEHQPQLQRATYTNSPGPGKLMGICFFCAVELAASGLACCVSTDWQIAKVTIKADILYFAVVTERCSLVVYVARLRSRLAYHLYPSPLNIIRWVPVETYLKCTHYLNMDGIVQHCHR